VEAVREHSATESLLSIVLGLEAVLLFFATLVVFGLRSVEPAIALSIGGALILLLAVTSRLQKYWWGPWLGWLLQAVLVATGLVIALMFVIGAGFAALYAYCFFRGRALDRARTAMIAEHQEISGETTP
jgi:Protein of unknown function (DUF4233)